jgi:hypothetical protein
MDLLLLPYSYAPLDLLKSEIITDRAVQDDLILRAGRFATSRIDEILHLKFAPSVGDIWLDSPTAVRIDHWSAVRLDDPLLSVTTFTDARGNTLVAGTDHQLYPRGQTPYTHLLMNDISVLSPGSGFSDVGKITGVTGWRRNYDRAWTTGGTVAGVNGVSTAVVVNDASLFQPGHFLRCQSEFMAVDAVNLDTNTLTVVRGINGSEAAAHSNQPVEIFSPEPNIVRACVKWAGLLFKRRGAFDSTTFDSVTTVTFPPDAPQEVMNILHGGPWNIFEGWIEEPL